MSYCINPYCPHPNDQEQGKDHICPHCGSELLLKGHYQIMRLISDKSVFGYIYEAYDGIEPKILKVLKSHHNQNPKVVELFYQEGKVLSQLQHPGIPKVELNGCFEFFPKDRSEPIHCLIMEKIEGLNLAQWMFQQGQQAISEMQALNWLRQLVNILDLIHKNNYFHRDIKPQNIMIRPNGNLVLIDFGTAREMSYTYLANLGATQGITKISSVGYTAPEQEKGYAIPQSDFYALGRTFVYLMTGINITDPSLYNPFNDELTWHQYATQISAPTLSLIDKLIASRAVDRPKTTREIMDYLDKIQSLHFSGKIYQAECSPDETTYLKTQADSIIDWVKGHKVNKKIGLSLGILLIIIAGYGGVKGFHHLSLNQQSIYRNFTNYKTLSGHLSFVNQVIFSHDGKTLISASADRTIKVWNLQTGALVKTLVGHESYVNTIVTTNDGRVLISGGADHTIRVWDLETGNLLNTIRGHTHAINTLILSTDDQTVISASADLKIKVWNWKTGQEIRTLTGHNNYINSIKLSPDGRLLISASADQTIKIWNLATGQEIRTLQGHSNYVNDIVITPDGKFIISGSADKTIKIWELNTGENLLTLAGNSGYINHLEINMDGETLASGGSDQTIRFWNINTGKEIGRLTGYSYPIQNFTLSPGWNYLAVGSGDRIITLWRLKL
jgi:WD40 repeat protein